MTEDQRNSDVTVAGGEHNDEFWMATVDFVKDEQSDILELGHPFLRPQNLAT